VDNTYWNSATNFNSTINQVIEGITGNYVAVGNFTTYQGVSQNRIVEINHTTGAKTALFGSGCSTQVRDIRMDSSGNFYIVASTLSNTFNGTTISSPVFKVDSSGNAVPLLTWGANQGTYNTAPSTIYLDEINGWLYLMGTQPQLFPRRLSLATGDIDTTWTNQQQTQFAGVGSNGARNFYVDGNNKVLIGNQFTIIQGQPYNRFIRLNPDGTSNTTTT
jgi:hypothetical protein